jgi:hypothetical protein
VLAVDPREDGGRVREHGPVGEAGDRQQGLAGQRHHGRAVRRVDVVPAHLEALQAGGDRDPLDVRRAGDPPDLEHGGG